MASQNPIWSPPSQGLWKLNVDASYDSKSGKVGYGVIIRNYKGCLVDGCAAIFTCLSPLAAEGMAIREALLVASRRGFTAGVVETDSHLMVQLCSSSGENAPWELEVVLHDIKFLLSSYPSLSVVYVARRANSCAHWVANQSRIGRLVSRWVANPPHQLAMLLAQDFPSCFVS
ncbi:uncharacterized protein LOC131179386 [Hevea brasiliensis]|uniref:uncharacterized protein LOC131179386 n=1 Tax=Hevea brasiliensis TaxID=3981 RepID=UPI0025F0B7A7|nr:uncharacterized protein LOC131179386 [Hevea brasiliensis]